MANNTNPLRVKKFHPGVALLACAALASNCANALQFQWGDIEGTFTSNISLGGSWRTSDYDPDLVSPGNTMNDGRASASVTDDGNLNFEKGEPFSLVLKGFHDLELSYKNWGVFTRIKYWYDQELESGKRPHGTSINNYVSGESLDDSQYADLAKHSGFELFDAYVYADLNIGEMPVELRIGKQVLSWGESTFIQNSANVINPIDVTALRKPGAELKEALLPVGLVYTNIGLTANLSAELFYQYDWEATVLDPCGTYFSNADVSGGGCNRLTLFSTFTDRDMVAGDIALPTFISRSPDRKPDDSGQWGVAFRYFAEELNYTEFGAYYINYHSRTPIFSGINSTVPGRSLLGLADQDKPRYFFDFPEDIEVFALTFATNIGAWAVSGEVSHRPKLPLAINTTEINQALALGNLAPWAQMLPSVVEAGPRGVVQGYREVEFTQAQFTFLRFFEQVMGAQRLSFVAEVGADFIGGLPDENELRFGRSPAFGIGDFAVIDTPAGPVQCANNTTPLLIAPNTQEQNCTNDGYITDFSWGYQIRASLDYSDAFMGINLTPSIAWSHDVHGYAPPPNFSEGRKAISVGLTADYLNTYEASISYTNFFDGDYSEIKDRDFISLSISVAF